MTDVGNMRARYRRILRFAARYLVQTWWFELFLPRIGLARLAARGPGGAAAAHRAALPRARGRPRRPHDQGRPVHVVAARRAAARDHQGARGAAGRGAAGAVRRDPARSPRPSWACRSSGRTRRSTRRRWPRHPSVRRTGPRLSPMPTPPTPGSTMSSSRSSGRASTTIVDVDLRGAAPRRRMAQPRAAGRPTASTCPRSSRSSRVTSLEEIDYLHEAANAERFARGLRRRRAGRACPRSCGSAPPAACSPSKT